MTKKNLVTNEYIDAVAKVNEILNFMQPQCSVSVMGKAKFLVYKEDYDSSEDNSPIEQISLSKNQLDVLISRLQTVSSLLK